MGRSGLFLAVPLGVLLLSPGRTPPAAGPPPASCTNMVVSETLSPNSRLKAVVFVRDCGKRLRNAHMSVLPALALLPEEPGNTFIGEETLAPADDNGRLAIQVHWLGPSELSVLHGVVKRVRYEERVAGVKVYYGHLVDLPLP